ncbi:acid phosphatase type 7 [Anabrus simplex]|uniref:acid phosphatase type 7 n=1 Tax=Anabrus simplex TaxID=316456 RepID=UPI0034DDBF83
MFSSLLVLTLLHLVSASFVPERVHLSFGDNPHEIIVTWSTKNNTIASVVEYGIGGLVKQAYGKPTLFRNPPEEGRPVKQQYIHRVKLRRLEPDSKYSYHVGSNLAWSNQFWFVTPPAEEDNWSPQLAIFGDLGNENAVSLPRLQKETQRGLYDAIIHIGDFAYDMDMDQGNYADEFFKEIESIAAYVPYMASPGNHEEQFNFTHYRTLFSMPGNTEGLMYSFNMGPVHFISISTEFYYFLKYGFKLVAKQYLWLERDLKEATSYSNRTRHPWIVVLGHRPMYCSNLNHDDCTYFETRTRVGLPVVGWFGLEDLFYNYGVDLMIWAHEHSYERLWPMYNYQVYNGSYEDPYRNPNAPVHITTGSAGCKEIHDNFKYPTPPWSAFQSTNYGFMRMKAFNSSHLYMEQISEDLEGQVIDHMWLIKDYHGPYKQTS